MKAVFDQCPECEFLRGVYEFNDRHPAFDLLAGSSLIRDLIVQGAGLREIAATWENDEAAFREISASYHLY